jgi:hypothetical protein
MLLFVLYFSIRFSFLFGQLENRIGILEDMLPITPIHHLK